jgi:hypothetical protein
MNDVSKKAVIGDFRVVPAHAGVKALCPPALDVRAMVYPTLPAAYTRLVEVHRNVAGAHEYPFQDNRITVASFALEDLFGYPDVATKGVFNDSVTSWLGYEVGTQLAQIWRDLRNQLWPDTSDKALATMLWESLTDWPFWNQKEQITEHWLLFPPSTHREDIWHWFEEEFDVSVAEDLMKVA